MKVLTSLILFSGQRDETTTAIQELLKFVWNACDLLLIMEFSGDRYFVKLV